MPRQELHKIAPGPDGTFSERDFRELARRLACEVLARSSPKTVKWKDASEWATDILRDFAMRAHKRKNHA